MSLLSCDVKYCVINVIKLNKIMCEIKYILLLLVIKGEKLVFINN